ncbi:unnamed protein product [Ectocarpus fasciculatus]
MSALGFDFLIEHAYPHATDLIQYLRRMGWVPEHKVALISKACCHLLSQSLKWTMCLEYPPTFRVRLVAYLSLLVNHVPPPPSGEWVEILQFEDPDQLMSEPDSPLPYAQHVENLFDRKVLWDPIHRTNLGIRACCRYRARVHFTVSLRYLLCVGCQTGAAYQLLDTLDTERGKTLTKITWGRVSATLRAQSESFSSKPRKRASTGKRKRVKTGAGTTSDTAEKRPRPRPPLPRGLPPNSGRSSSSWSSKSGPPATTKRPKTCTPWPPTTPKLCPPTTPKPRPPTTPKPVKMPLPARPPSTPKPRPPTTPKPLKWSTPLSPNIPKPLKSFTPPPPNAPKPSLTLAARPPSTSKPRPPTTLKPRQTSAPNLLKNPAPRPPSTPKPLQTSTPLPVSTTKGLESFTFRPSCMPNLLKQPAPKPPSTPKPIRMPITPPSPCTPKPLNTSAPPAIGKGANPVAPAGSSRLPSYGKAPRPPSVARSSPLGKAPPAKKPRPPPCPRLSAKTHLRAEPTALVHRH